MSEFNSPHTLMVQGTTSDAGKSLLVTALCRILHRHGYAVAPFKPQNMSLNSAVTVDGGEIGRAQAVQAEACCIPPSTDMNPILLKPNSDVGAQVIISGKAIGNFKAQEYHALKPELLGRVVQAHQRLQSQFEVTVVEGAGSPAEINLREHDIANMGFAERIDCPVIIVADIDRGGVFAHLLGTYELLSEQEKQRIKGFVINKFRGDVALLTPGLEWLTLRTGVPVLGVIPYIPDLHIEAEDSLKQVSGRRQSENSIHSDNRLHIVVPLYPRTSNHTDFDALQQHPGLSVTFLRDPNAFCGADLIILPGSKHVRGDLAWLHAQGWDELIRRHLRFGGKVIGICGGYQMLGQWVHDPKGVESAPGSSRGLNLLDVETTLTGEKTLCNVSGYLLDEGSEKRGVRVSGYEIHAGITQGSARAHPLFSLTHDEYESIQSKAREEGARSGDNRVLGSYLHGMFDTADMLNYLIHWVAPERGQALSGMDSSVDYADFRQQQIDKLADHVEEVFTIEQIKTLLSLKTSPSSEKPSVEQAGHKSLQVQNG